MEPNVNEFKNTDVEFFHHWSKSQLEIECARLNKVLAETAQLCSRAILIDGEKK